MKTNGIAYVVKDTQFGGWIVTPSMTTKHLPHATRFASAPDARRAAKAWNKAMDRGFCATEIQPVLS